MEEVQPTPALPPAQQDSIAEEETSSRVTFQDQPVQPLPLNKLPEGWSVLKDGMSLGKEPGSIVFQEGSLYGPQSVEMDKDAYERPIWRFRCRPGTPRPAKGVIPVR